ncbi:hypothetical protein RB196_35465 [Streptomyces sp. PmtA]|uniref:hypothetical protein n=1 Tax=Streptomyces sp. PmtA TaxID=3074275 RepID=UPI003014EE2B
MLGTGEAEELAQPDQPALTGFGQGGEEGFDVVNIDEGPVAFVPLVDQEERQVTQDGQGGFQGVVAAGAGVGTPGPLLGPYPGGIEGDDGLLQRFGDRVDAASAAADRESFGLVSGQGQATEGEEVLECTG